MRIHLRLTIAHLKSDLNISFLYDRIRNKPNTGGKQSDFFMVEFKEKITIGVRSIEKEFLIRE